MLIAVTFPSLKFFALTVMYTVYGLLLLAIAILCFPYINVLYLYIYKLNLIILDPGGVLPFMGHIGMCRCEGYGFQVVYSSIGYINQSVWSRRGYHFSRN